MGKALIIAEKPSVAKDIAAALGGFSRTGSYYESADAVISNGIGHLVGIAQPEGEGKSWELADLPYFPQEFMLVGLPRTADQLKLLGTLLKRSDIDTVINACDAGREGELIFSLIVRYHRTRKPVKRMWLQSMTPDSIRSAYANMRTEAQMAGLSDAARARSEADWEVGVNATRAVTKFREHIGKDEGVASAGRVQTPVLTLLYHREKAILKFVPRDFWEIHGRFKVVAGSYDSKWFDPNHPKSDDDAVKADRLFDTVKAQAIEDKCRGAHPSSVTEESKPKKTMPPKLFDLTTLQREANTKFGFSAKKTLDLAQALYEKHKALSYPRTESSALPEDYVESAKQILATLRGTSFDTHASRVLENDWVKPEKRIFDNSKISDHFAIIPTTQKASGLDSDEQKIYDLVVRRFIAVFHPAAEYLQTVRLTIVAGESFKSQGSVLVAEGWLVVYGKEADSESGNSLCALRAGESAQTESIKRVGLKTSPPERYTEATLLGAMENAGRLVDDEELKDALKARGLGTPATRAATIEELLSPSRLYMTREKKYLVPTQKGMDIISLLLENGIEQLTSAAMTGEWEFKLRQVEEGKLSWLVFKEGVRQQAIEIVEQLRRKASETAKVSSERKGGGAGGSTGKSGAATVTCEESCPKCGGVVQGHVYSYDCGSCDFKMRREVASRQITEKEACKLMKDKLTPVLKGFYSPSKKKKFDAMLALTDDFKVEFRFADQTAPESSGPVVAVGACPKCSADVVARSGGFACANNHSGATTKCDFRISGVIAGRAIDNDVATRLLASRKTALLTGFKSSKPPHRAFEAYLVLKPTNVIEFEFAQR